jgi:hypothetical protein
MYSISNNARSQGYMTGEHTSADVILDVTEEAMKKMGKDWPSIIALVTDNPMAMEAVRKRDKDEPLVKSSISVITVNQTHMCSIDTGLLPAWSEHTHWKDCSTPRDENSNHKECKNSHILQCLALLGRATRLDCHQPQNHLERRLEDPKHFPCFSNCITTSVCMDRIELIN